MILKWIFLPKIAILKKINQNQQQLHLRTWKWIFNTLLGLYVARINFCGDKLSRGFIFANGHSFEKINPREITKNVTIVKINPREILDNLSFAKINPLTFFKKQTLKTIQDQQGPSFSFINNVLSTLETVVYRKWCILFFAPPWF